VSKWYPIETAPKDGTQIMLWNPDWECPVFASWNDTYEESFWQASEELISDVIGAVEDALYWCRFEAPPS
jgi:hypothetical protein